MCTISHSISSLQALHEVHKILGQVNILGSPIVLGSNIFEGLRTFFNEPLKAKNPKQFARGIGKGSVALVKFSAFGFLEAIGQVSNCLIYLSAMDMRRRVIVMPDSHKDTAWSELNHQ